MRKNKQIVTFTCSSFLDPLDCVTVTARRIGVDDVENITVVLRVPNSKKKVKVPFRANRYKTNNLVSTYRSTEWPPELPIPEISAPVHLEVVDII